MTTPRCPCGAHSLVEVRRASAWVWLCCACEEKTRAPAEPLSLEAAAFLDAQAEQERLHAAPLAAHPRPAPALLGAWGAPEEDR
jgi:hypothetical protein